MAEEIKNNVENEEQEKEIKVKKTPGQKLDAALAAVTSVPKKIGSAVVNGGKKAGLAVGTAVLMAFGAGVLLDRKGVFDGALGADEEPSNLIEEGPIKVEPDVLDIEPEVVENEV